MSGAEAAAAVAAAEAERRRREEEEEEMTKYTDADLQGEWEFKIIRANTAVFENPELLRRVCDEEAQAGWVLLEKFDNQRLRFKRPMSAREGDSALGIDPYRTHYGISTAAYTTIILVCTAICTVMGIALFFWLIRFLVNR